MTSSSEELDLDDDRATSRTKKRKQRCNRKTARKRAAHADSMRAGRQAERDAQREADDRAAHADSERARWQAERDAQREADDRAARASEGSASRVRRSALAWQRQAKRRRQTIRHCAEVEEQRRHLAGMCS